MNCPTAPRPFAAALLRSCLAVVVALGVLLPVGAAMPQVARAAATGLDPRVVIVAGPVGSYNAHYRADADALAAVARRYTRNVVLLKTPHATWSAVRAAAQGAAILIYLGHGNGWPSRYRDYLWPFSQDGMGLDPETGADGTAHDYYGEAQIASEIRLAPNAVVLLFHLCYASGNTEPGLATGTLADKKARVDNYGAGFFAAGARAVIADAYHPNVTYLTRLFTASATIDRLFHVAPTYHGHDIAWDSTRTAGARIVMDPTDPVAGPWYHSIVYQPGLTAAMVTRTRYAPTDTVPAGFVVPGAAVVATATDLFGDAGLTAPTGTLPTATRLRTVAEAAPLADGARVLQVRTLDGAAEGFVRAADLVPADSTPARLDTWDAPGALIGPNGDYVHDTFHVVVRASEPLDGTIEIRDASGALVKTLTATDAWSVFDWDLHAADAALVSDGRYTWSYVGREPWGNNPTPFRLAGGFALDATVPTTTAASSGILHPTGWYTGPATVTLAGKDAFSGMAATYYRIDGGLKTRYAGPFRIVASGDHAVSYWSVDQAGNVEGARTLQVKVDVSPPVTTAQLAGPVGEPGFYRGDVTVSLTAVDPQSGVASTDVSLDGAPLAPDAGPFAVTAEGSHRLLFRSTDRTGRVEATRRLDFTIDRTAPTLGAPGSVTAPAQLSPNGDGLADGLPIRHALSEPGAIRLVVTERTGGTTVRTQTMPVPAAGAGTIAWDGRSDAGAVVPDGDYSVSLTPLDRARNAGPAVALDVSVFGAFVGLSGTPARFYPQDGDRLAPRTVAAFSLRTAADVELRVLNAAGVAVRTISGTYPVGPVAIAWDGRTDAGTFAPQGAYRLLVTASAGGRSETHTVAVRAAAFEIRPSASIARRRHRLTVTVAIGEALRAAPRLVVRQPGLAAYGLKMRAVGSGIYRVSWIVRPGRRTGTMTLTVVGTDRAGGRNATALTLRIR